MFTQLYNKAHNEPCPGYLSYINDAIHGCIFATGFGQAAPASKIGRRVGRRLPLPYMKMRKNMTSLGSWCENMVWRHEIWRMKLKSD